VRSHSRGALVSEDRAPRVTRAAPCLSPRCWLINYFPNPLRSCPSTKTVWGHLTHSRRRTGAIVRPSRGTLRATFIRAPQRGQPSSRARASSCSSMGAVPARTPPHSLPRTKFGSAARSCKCAFINPRERGRGVTENPGTVGAPRCLCLGDPQCCLSYLGRVVGGPGRRAAAGALPQNACDRFTGPATRRTGSNSESGRVSRLEAPRTRSYSRFAWVR
jgi:hypothetical protein